MDLAMPTDVLLRPMSEAELAGRLPSLVEEYAADLRLSGRVADNAEAALAEATQQITASLSDGVHTDGKLLYVAEVNGTAVGWVWLGLPRPGGPDVAWVHNIEIDRDHRRRGYGQALLLAAERELLTRGVRRVGLNVFGHNTEALRLYARLRYSVTAQQMVKDLKSGGDPNRPEAG
jgi:mycothiol synthase